MEAGTKEVLLLDTNVFIAEIGLTSRRGSALKHYLSCRGMQLVVPEVVVEESERHLIQKAKGRRAKVEENLQWLGRFCGEVEGWMGPSDEAIEQRAGALARAEHLDAVVVRETPGVRHRAKLRNRSERPPSRKNAQPSDCRIWEQCLELLDKYHVVFVSHDGDFRGHRHQDKLHPTLQEEADEIAQDRLTFHRNMESLLSDLKSEIQPIPDGQVFDFVYESIAPVVEELESNSGCRPKRIGQVEQTLLTTDEAEVIEVRLEIADSWTDADGVRTMDFRLFGSCRYRPAKETLHDLMAHSVNLLARQPDGSLRAVKGSYVHLGGHAYVGAPPIRPGPEVLGTWVSTD